jgi:Phage terminase large subunit
MSSTLVHEYTPRGGCLDAVNSRAPELVLSGPAGTGKSRALLERLHLIALCNPGMAGLIVRKVAATLPNTGIKTWEKFVVGESMAAGAVEYFGGSQREAACYRYANGSRIDVGGMDKASKIMSAEYDVIYVQEATELTVADWEALTTRLRNGRVKFQQLMADCNPDRPEHWLKQRADRWDILMLESRHTDNPVLYGYVTGVPVLTERGRAYMELLNKLTGPRRLRLRDGLWVGAEGMVYGEEWDPAIHVVPRFDIPWEWPRFWSVDFGHTHPFVLQCWALDPDGRAYLYREIFATKRTVDQHAMTVLGLVRTRNPDLPEGVVPDPRNGRHWVWTEPQPQAIVCDHDAEGRATLETWLGRSAIAAYKKVREGVEAVQVRMRPADDGRPRLFIFADAIVSRDTLLAENLYPATTIEEIPGYVWNETKDQPVKDRDDGCDAMRYMTAYWDLQGKPRVRWI